MLHPHDEHSPEIAPGAFVHPSAVVIGQAFIGRDSSIWPNVTLRGDDGPIHIGDESSIQDGSTIHCTHGWSHTVVGNRVTVGHNVILHGCRVADMCLIGMGAIVMDNAVVERGAIVGAGALVPPNKVVKAGTLVVGNPCRVLRPCNEQDIAMIEHGWRAYTQRAREYLALNLELKSS